MIRLQEPVTLGLPFPQGLVVEHDGRPQLAVAGAKVFQTRTLARWPDGSVRWALVDFQADVEAGRASTSYHVIPGPGASPDPPLARVAQDRIAVDSLERYLEERLKN